MATAPEQSYERTVRVKVPPRALYWKLDSVDRLAQFIPQIDRHVTAADLKSAITYGCLALGPVSWQLTGEIQVERTDPPHTLAVSLCAPTMQLHCHGMLEFSAAAADETSLQFRATIRSTHPLLRRMRSSLTSVLEDLVDATTDRVAILAYQHDLAERTFAEPTGHRKPRSRRRHRPQSRAATPNPR